MYDAVLFDLDGVLIDTDDAVTALWRQISVAYGRHLSDADVHAHVLGCSPEHTVTALFPDQPGETHSAILAAVRHGEPRLGYRAHDDAIPLLTALARHGLRLALVTSASPARTSAILADLGVAGAFETMVTWGEAGRGKPAPDPYLLAARRLGVAPARCVVFEDAPSGIRSAIAAGMCCVAVDRSGAGDLARHGAAAVVTSLDDVRLQRRGGPAEPVVLSLPNRAADLLLRGRDVPPSAQGEPMTVTVRIPAALLPRTGGERLLTATGATLGELLDDLSGNYHGLVQVVRRQGALCRFVNIYLNGDDVRSLGGLQAALHPGDEVLILPAVAGG